MPNFLLEAAAFLLALLLLGGVLYFCYAIVVSGVAAARLLFNGFVDMVTLKSLRQELQKFRH